MTHYEEEKILVTLDWIPENGISYSITTIPEAAAVVFNATTSVQLELHYNTLYNVSILATLCGQSNTTTAVYHSLNISESSHPTLIHDNLRFPYYVLLCS